MDQTETTPRKSRVEWTDDEMEYLAEHWVGTFLNNPGKPILPLLNGVQGMMNPARRRNITQLQQIPKLYDLFKKKLQQLKVDAKKGKLPPPAPEKILVQPDPGEILEKMHPAQLMLALFTKLHAEFEETRATVARIEKMLPKVLQTPSANGHVAPVTHATPPHKKLKIVVIGLMSVQFATLEAEFGRDCKLVYVEKELSSRHIPTCDHVILAKKFITHTWQEAAYDAMPRDKVHVIDGAATNIALHLREILATKAIH